MAQIDEKINTNTFFSAARLGDNRFGIYVAVVMLVIIANVLGSLPGGWALVQQKEGYLHLPVYTLTSLMLLGFVFSLMVLWLCVKYIHKRNPLTMISPTVTVNWRRVAKSAGLWLLCTMAVELTTYFLFPEKYRLSLNWGDFLPSLVLGLLLIPLQTSFEELFFRGYLMQGIGSWNGWIGIVFTSVLFGLAHSFNDEVEAVGSLGIAMIYYIGVGLFFALLAYFDKTLELPLGIHAANNVYAFLAVGYPSSSVPSATVWMINELNFPLMMAQWVVALGFTYCFLGDY
ncbi:MAG: CPBP family intramembrane glutamic endopeptidase [Spirosomataceae bacterium]